MFTNYKPCFLILPATTPLNTEQVVCETRPDPKREKGGGNKDEDIITECLRLHADRACDQRGIGGHDSGQRLHVPELGSFQSKDD
jgi:hypothetical protein